MPNRLFLGGDSFDFDIKGDVEEEIPRIRNFLLAN